jgi:hypothetical protein
VRAACEKAAREFTGLPVFAGAKSYGGRMTSQAHALDPLSGVVGLVLVGFPLHAAGKPPMARAARLPDTAVAQIVFDGGQFSTCVDRTRRPRNRAGRCVTPADPALIGRMKTVKGLFTTSYRTVGPAITSVPRPGARADSVA